MAVGDGKVGVKQSAAPDRQIDNEVVTNATGDEVYRQRVAAGPLIPVTPKTKVATVTASGATTLIAAVSGKKLVVHYLYFTPRGDGTSPLVDVRFITSTDPLARGYAFAKTWRWTGATNEGVEAVLSAAGNVAFTILYEEMNP